MADEAEQQLEAILRQQELQRGELGKIAERGESMGGWIKSNWPFFFNEVIAPMEKEAYDTFRHPDFDPTKVERVVQIQAILRVIDMVRTKTDDVIARGREARAKLIQMQQGLPEKEGV